MGALYSCRPLFASSLLGIIRTLLEQTRHDEMRIMGCNALVDFINCQVRSNMDMPVVHICVLLGTVVM